MLNIQSIFKHVLTELMQKSPRIKVIDSEHIYDTKTGAKYHMYDEYFKITYDGEPILKTGHLTPEEQSVIWEIKQLITDPMEAQKKMEEYPAMLKKKREQFSEIYEHPSPPMSKEPMVEANTTEYQG